jgi:hypothetical protein
MGQDTVNLSDAEKRFRKGSMCFVCAASAAFNQIHDGPQCFSRCACTFRCRKLFRNAVFEI